MHREIFMATNGYKETREQKIRSNKWRENMEYMGINLNIFLDKFKENIDNGIDRMYIRKEDVPFSRYVKIDGENIWVQRRFDMLKGYLCAYFTLRGYVCTTADKEITIKL